ncbi:competence/damage-inducible protein A [Streptomyces sp. NPDC026206]|uniref:competence/damage-inducible protein A n=1 Tax=Streptomyces sp. NPDC026206 TaxID=3157089 RepID=UPI0033D9285F
MSIEKIVSASVPEPTAAVLTVGDELLSGEVADTNSAAAGAALRGGGFRVVEHRTVGDSLGVISAAVQSLLHADVLIVIGGLGPTSDDVTRFGLADALGRDLEHRAEAWDAVVERLTRFGLTVHESNRQQALFPRGTELLPNGNGTAWGALLETGATRVVMLPGPPKECRPVLDDALNRPTAPEAERDRTDLRVPAYSEPSTLRGVMRTTTRSASSAAGAARRGTGRGGPCRAASRPRIRPTPGPGRRDRPDEAARLRRRGGPGGPVPGRRRDVHHRCEAARGRRPRAARGRFRPSSAAAVPAMSPPGCAAGPPAPAAPQGAEGSRCRVRVLALPGEGVLGLRWHHVVHLAVHDAAGSPAHPAAGRGERLTCRTGGPRAPRAGTAPTR